jgi:hypothetical protein
MKPSRRDQDGHAGARPFLPERLWLQGDSVAKFVHRQWAQNSEIMYTPKQVVPNWPGIYVHGTGYAILGIMYTHFGGNYWFRVSRFR